MNELDAANLSFDARVVLVGRTGLDDVARNLRGSDVIRVRTPIEAIAEVAIPSNLDAPECVVVVVGTDSALSIDEFGENGDGATEFLRGLHSIHPHTRLLRAVNRRNLNDPIAGGYHGVVPIDATPGEFFAAFAAASRIAMNGEGSGAMHAEPSNGAAAIRATDAGLSDKVVHRSTNGSSHLLESADDPDTFFAGIQELSRSAAREPEEHGLHLNKPVAAPKEVAPPAPRPVAPVRAENPFEELASYPSMMAAPGGMFINGFTTAAVPIAAKPLQASAAPPVPSAPAAAVPPAASSHAQPTQPARAHPFSLHESAAQVTPAGPVISASDRMLQAILAGTDPKVAALEIIREAVGDPSVMLTDVSDSLPGVIVAFDGRPLAKLRARVSPEVLTPHAAWLGQWLRLDEHLGQLRDWAFTDALTGAWNRRYFEMFLADSLEEARVQRRSLSMLIFDIDNFKQWNDENGHAAGDEILIETVKLLKSVIRPSDKVCRIGGDEFAVIFYEPQGPRDLGSRHPEDLSEIAKRFQAQIRNKRFPKLAATHTPLGISGGLATYPWDARTAEELISLADQRAMQSKRLGKNAIIFGDETAR